MTRYLKSALRWTLGILCFVFGLVSTFALPLVPQIPFFVAALILLMPESRWLRKRYVLWKRRHPRIFKAIENWRERHREHKEARRESRRLRKEERAKARGRKPVEGVPAPPPPPPPPPPPEPSRSQGPSASSAPGA